MDRDSVDTQDLRDGDFLEIAQYLLEKYRDLWLELAQYDEEE